MTADTHPVAVSDQADEIARQYALLSRVEWVRTITTCITYGMMSMFLPVWIPFLAMIGDLVMERMGLHLMRGLDPARMPRRYLASLVSVGVMEAVAEPFTRPESIRVELAPLQGQAILFAADGETPGSLEFLGETFERR